MRGGQAKRLGDFEAVDPWATALVEAEAGDGLVEGATGDRDRAGPILDRQVVRGRVGPRLRFDVEAEGGRGHAVAVWEVARPVGQELAAADDARASDELREVEHDVGRRADV